MCWNGWITPVTILSIKGLNFVAQMSSCFLNFFSTFTDLVKFYYINLYSANSVPPSGGVDSDPADALASIYSGGT